MLIPQLLCQYISYASVKQNLITNWCYMEKVEAQPYASWREQLLQGLHKDELHSPHKPK